MESPWRSAPFFEIGDSLYLLDSPMSQGQVVLQQRWNTTLGEWLYQVSDRSWHRQCWVVAWTEWQAALTGV